MRTRSGRAPAGTAQGPAPSLSYPGRTGRRHERRDTPQAWGAKARWSSTNFRWQWPTARTRAGVSDFPNGAVPTGHVFHPTRNAWWRCGPPNATGESVRELKWQDAAKARTPATARAVILTAGWCSQALCPLPPPAARASCTRTAWHVLQPDGWLAQRCPQYPKCCSSAPARVPSE